jgi:hypothetical protein
LKFDACGQNERREEIFGHPQFSRKNRHNSEPPLAIAMILFDPDPSIESRKKRLRITERKVRIGQRKAVIINKRK